MTTEQKEKIKVLRANGLGYKKVATSLGLSVNTVKSFCRNHALTGDFSHDICLVCGKPLVQVAKRKHRKFCSAECREKWWSKNRHKASGEKVHCAHCGRVFTAYKHEHRKYCSHACYVAERFQGGGSND